MSINHDKHLKISSKIQGYVCNHNVDILYILRQILGNQINLYLELGVHNGTSMGYVVSGDTPVECYGIDLFEDTYEKSNRVWKLNMNKSIKNIENCKNNADTKFTLIKGNTHDKDTVDKLKKHLSGRKIDLLLIDASHTYESVKKDFEIYHNFVRKGGIIVADDYDKKHPGIQKFFDTDVDKTQYQKLFVYNNSDLILVKK